MEKQCIFVVYITHYNYKTHMYDNADMACFDNKDEAWDYAKNNVGEDDKLIIEKIERE